MMVLGGEAGAHAIYPRKDDQAAPVAMKYRQANGTFANYFFVTNPHGDVVAVTDRDGAVVNQYAYGPWGEATRISERIHQPFRYGGYYFDDTTGLYWLTSRFYEPTTGRFLSKDSANPDLRDIKSLNAYIYADDAPATHVDPAGTSPVKPRSSGPWKPKVGPPKPKPQPFKPKQAAGGGGPAGAGPSAGGGFCGNSITQTFVRLFSPVNIARAAGTIAGGGSYGPDYVALGLAMVTIASFFVGGPILLIAGLSIMLAASIADVACNEPDTNEQLSAGDYNAERRAELRYWLTQYD